jgi:hypothetical protein
VSGYWAEVVAGAVVKSIINLSSVPGAVAKAAVEVGADRVVVHAACGPNSKTYWYPGPCRHSRRGLFTSVIHDVAAPPAEFSQAEIAAFLRQTARSVLRGACAASWVPGAMADVRELEFLPAGSVGRTVERHAVSDGLLVPRGDEEKSKERVEDEGKSVVQPRPASRLRKLTDVTQAEFDRVERSVLDRTEKLKSKREPSFDDAVALERFARCLDSKLNERGRSLCGFIQATIILLAGARAKTNELCAKRLIHEAFDRLVPAAERDGSGDSDGGEGDGGEGTPATKVKKEGETKSDEEGE